MRERVCAVGGQGVRRESRVRCSEMVGARKVAEWQIHSKLMSIPRGTLVIYFLSLFR